MISEATQPLTPRAASAIIAPTPEPMPQVLRAYLELRYKTLRMELVDVMRMLGYNQKRCPHCGHELK